MTKKLPDINKKADPFGHSEVVKEHTDLNDVETLVWQQMPLLRRIPSHAKPRAIVQQVEVGHNPDFRLYRYYVEIKGYRYKSEWIRLLREIPFGERYKVLLVGSTQRDRSKLRKKIQHANPTIEVVEIQNVDLPTLLTRWLTEAAADWEACSEDEKEDTRIEYLRTTGEIPTWLNN